MLVDVIDDLGRLLELRSNWEAVYAADLEAQFFLSWTWIFNWLKPGDRNWFILAAKLTTDAKEYVAFFPLRMNVAQSDDGFLYNMVSMAGRPLAGYTGLLCLPHHQDQAIPALTAALKTFHWRDIQLNRLNMSKERLDAFTAAFPREEFNRGAIADFVDGDDTDYTIYPYVKLAENWETYLAQNLGSATRKNARSVMRKLDEGKDLRITLSTAASLQQDLDILLRLWAIKWAPKPGDRRQEIANYRKMLPLCFEADMLFLAVLWQGDTPIGAQGTLIDREKRTLICLLGARELSVKNVSPGFVIHLYSIRWAIQNGFTIYDLQLGAHKYKYDFGVEERSIKGLWLGSKTKKNLGGQLDRHTLPVALRMAQTMFASGKFMAAAQSLRQILDVDPGNADAKVLLARIPAAQDTPTLDAATALHRSGKLEDAKAMYAAILRAQPDHFDATHLLGVVFLQQKNTNEAEQQIRRAIELKSDFAAAHNNLGSVLLEQKRFAEALASFDRAIALHKDYAEAFNNRGTALRGLGRMDEALASYNSALALKPDYSRAIQNRAAILRSLNTPVS